MSNIENKGKQVRAYTKGRPLALEIQASLDQIYRSNPYPSRFEYEGYSKDLNCDVVRIRNWFCSQRRRDFKTAKLCRHCRYFKAPIEEERHVVSHRPCVSYWSLPTVAPPPMIAPPSTVTSYWSPSKVSSSTDSAVDEPQESEQIIAKLEEVNQTAQQSMAAVPSAVSLTVQQSMYNFQQPPFNPEPSSWYHPQPGPIPYPIDMCTGGNCWVMRSTPAGSTPYWIPLNYSHTSEMSQIQLDYHPIADWRSTRIHRSTPYTVPTENSPHHMKPEMPIDNPYEEGSSNNHH